MPLIRNVEAVLALPYTQRQLVVVEPRRMQVSPPDVEGATSRLGRAAAGVGRGLDRAADRIRRRRASKAAGVKDLRPLRVEMSAAVASLRFPPGHPHEGLVYVADPVRSGTYYPAADFHRRTFERKFSDAVRMLMALGATGFEVLYHEGWGEEFAGELNVSNAIHRVKGRTKKGSAGETKVLFQAEFDPREPLIPDDVPWMSAEPTWEDVAAGRMRHGLRRFALSVSYYEDFRIESDFEDKMKGIGLELGGKLEKFKRTRWDIRGEFAPFD